MEIPLEGGGNWTYFSWYGRYEMACRAVPEYLEAVGEFPNACYSGRAFKPLQGNYQVVVDIYTHSGC